MSTLKSLIFRFEGQFSIKERTNGYFFAFISTLLTLGFRFLIHPIMGTEAPMLSFILPVILTALLYGLKPGLLATMLAMIFGAYFFLPPFNSFHVEKSEDYVRLAIFLVEGMLIGILGEFIKAKDLKLKNAIKDVSESVELQKKADEKIRSLEADLSRAWRINTLGEMATGLAHELSQPIAAIKNYTGALEKLIGPEADPVVIRSVKEVSLEAERASSFIHSLRSFIGSRTPDKNIEDINELISDVGLLVKNELESQNIKMRLNLAEPGIKVPIDKIQLLQVILNLFRNSIESMSSNSNGDKEIFVGTSNQNNGVLICVADTGSGIFSSDKNRVFDPFFTTKKSGMGMGLAISRSVIELHEGKIWNLPNEPKGTSFFIWLPIKVVF